MLRTNKHNIEKVLLQQESFRRTLLLLLDGAFARDESALSEALQALYQRCPLVFQDYLGLSYPEPEESSDESDATEEFASTQGHTNIRPWRQISAKEICRRFNITVRLSNVGLMHPFCIMLRHAYDSDYKRPHVLDLGAKAMQWWQKVTFRFRYVFSFV